MAMILPVSLPRNFLSSIASQYATILYIDSTNSIFLCQEVYLSKTALFKEVIAAIKKAGCELVRPSPSNSHLIYRTPDNRNIVVPRKLDDRRVAHLILKLAQQAKP